MEIIKLTQEFKEHLLKLLNDVQEDFSPPLSQRVQIDDYADKLLERANIYAIIINENIAGALAIYANDYENCRAYIPFLAVGQLYRDKRIATILISHTIEEIRKLGFKEIRLECLENSPAHRLYVKNGFERMNQIENERTSSVYLRLRV
jgi:ribosomal protein S18 acetylase RimI-like enzyme